MLNAKRLNFFNVSSHIANAATIKVNMAKTLRDGIGNKGVNFTMQKMNIAPIAI